MALFYVWCASIAGDIKECVVCAHDKKEALSQIPVWFRQDWEIHPATIEEALRLGCELDGKMVVFEDKFFKYNPRLKQLEYDCYINYRVRPELWRG